VCRAVGFSAESFSFYRTHNGAELDLLWQYEGKNWGVECKMGDAPSTNKSMKTVCKDLNLEHLWVVYPGREEWQLDTNISVKSIYSIGKKWNYGNSK
jgi:uncharacterized protein